jgi:ribosomal protein S10
MMVSRATSKRRIGDLKLTSSSKQTLCNIDRRLTSIADACHKLVGPVSFPKRTYCVPVRRAPGGNGSGTYDHYKRIQHKRLYEIIDFSTIDAIFEVLNNIKNVSYSIVFY